MYQFFTEHLFLGFCLLCCIFFRIFWAAGNTFAAKVNKRHWKKYLANYRDPIDE